MHDVTYITSGSPVVREDAAAVLVRIHRGEHGLDDATIFYTTDAGTATEGDDYKSRTGQIVMGAPRDDRSVKVDLIDDGRVEDVEDFEFRLVRAKGGTLLRVPSIVTVTIADNDGPSRLSFARGGFVNFENRGSIAVTLVRSGDAAAEASVDLVTAGAGAEEGADYTPVSETVTFSPGDRAEVVFIPVIDDADGEATEQISLSLGPPTGGALSDPQSATAEILDDDSGSADTQAPVTQFHRPRHGSVYRSKQFGSLHVVPSDDASGIATLKGALRMNLRGGACKWYNDKTFVRRPCSKKKWVDLEVRTFVYWRLHGKLQRSTAATGIKNYTAFALSTDEAGNAERAFERGRNRNTFRIK
jgi:hypothetical protein